MTATDELRRLLDERGVEWESADFIEPIAETQWGNNCYIDYPELSPYLTISYCTPEQAIAATLGRGTCKLEGFADVRFSVDYEVEGYAVGSSIDYATLEECSSCGAYVIEPPAFHHVLTCDGDEIYQPYNYCPNCGAKVVEQ